MKKILYVIWYTVMLSQSTISLAVESAPRITDREIIEGLAEVRGDIKRLEAKIDADIKRLEAKIDADIKRLEAKVGADIKRLEEGQKALDKRIDDLRSEMNNQFNSLWWQLNSLWWLINIFVAVALIILGFVLRMQWQMNKRMTHVETSLETQKDELAFLKGLIERLLPPRSAL